MPFSVLNDTHAPEVHASTLLIVKGDLLSAWFGGIKEGHPDTKIWLSRRPLTEENAWSRPEVVASEDGLAHWNPVLLQLPETERIVLFYKVGSPISSWRTCTKESEDGGRTWSAARELVPGDKGGRGPVKNKCIILSDGKILAPASVESVDGVWNCFTDASTDLGQTWKRSAAVRIDRTKLKGEGAIQPSLIEHRPGGVTMLTRSSTGHVLRADSEDSGETWSDMYETPLLNNNSGLDSLKMDNDQWLVVHNPVQQRWGPRTPLIISGSTDRGMTWIRKVILEDKPPPKGFDRIVALDTGIVNDGESEFSYPAIIGDGHGGVYVSYTYERVGIKHVHIKSDQLK